MAIMMLQIIQSIIVWELIYACFVILGVCNVRGQEIHNALNVQMDTISG